MSKSFFNKIIYFDTIDSTNTYFLNNDFENRTIVYSFNQTCGRGRNNKKWVEFYKKNLALSYAIKDDLNINNQIWLTACSSIALVKLLNKYKIKNSWIKWPNDIYVDDNKIAGILTESVLKGNDVKKIITGIGVNINCSKDELSGLGNKATSVLIETGRMIDMNKFFSEYKSCLEKWLNLLINKKSIIKVKKTWLKHCKIIGKKIKSDTIAGIVTAIDDEGCLIVKQNEQLIKIFSGDVVLDEIKN